MIKYEHSKKEIIINDSNILRFNNNIENIVDFDDMIIVMLIDEQVPENNIIAFDEYGNKLWDISGIIRLRYKETYVSLSRIDKNTISVISYSGLETYIDVKNKKVISQTIKK